MTGSLGVDFGTSTTVAVVRRPDGGTRPLLFDGSPLLSSAVLLGDREVEVRELIAAVLRRVAVEAERVGVGTADVVLTHPVESDRSPGVSFGHASCLVGVTHVDGTGLGDSITILDFSVWIYEDVADAQRYHREHLDNARVNKQDPVTVAGLGDEAFTHRRHAAVTGPATQVEFTLEVRHSNMHFIALIKADRIAEGGWSRATRTKIEEAFLASARATYARLATK